MTGMCPHCGAIVRIGHTLTVRHLAKGEPCPGSRQNPRNPESDARPLWNGERNPHFHYPKQCDGIPDTLPGYVAQCGRTDPHPPHRLTRKHTL